MERQNNKKDLLHVCKERLWIAMDALEEFAVCMEKLNRDLNKTSASRVRAFIRMSLMLKERMEHLETGLPENVGDLNELGFSDAPSGERGYYFRDRKQKNRNHSYVYIIEAVGQGGIYKIGKADDVERRMKSFTYMPFKTRLIHKIKTSDAYELESSLHDTYANKRIHGEWFRLSGSDIDNIIGGQNGIA